MREVDFCLNTFGQCVSITGVLICVVVIDVVFLVERVQPIWEDSYGCEIIVRRDVKEIQRAVGIVLPNDIRITSEPISIPDGELI